MQATRAILSVILASAPIAAQGQTVYHGFTLLDPIAQRATEDSYIVVRGGRIAEVGRGRPSVGGSYRFVDMSGRYALPGFIDSHAHVTIGVRHVDMSGSQPVLRENPTDSITRFNALVALASGITTIRNPAGVPAANRRYADRIRAGDWVGPTALQAGSLFGGFPLEWAQQPADTAAWRVAIDAEKTTGFDYVKLYTGLSEQELQSGIEAAHAHGLRTIAHLDRVSWTRAARLGVDALTHALPTSEDLLEGPARSAYVATRRVPSAKFMYQWFEWADLDSAPIQEMIGLLASRQIEVDLTLVVNELVYWFDRLDSLPIMKRDDWMHPAHQVPWRQQFNASVYDWTPEDFARAKAVMPKVLDFARRLHAAGVPLLIGTDGTGGGPIFARELELHVQAGIPVWEVLALSTTRAAERLGLGALTGALKVGLEADIVFLDRDPRRDISNVSQITMVVVDGKAYTAQDLVALARGFAAAPRPRRE